MEESLQEYRTHLVAAEQKAQEDYDKTVISLSGGALGISFAFIVDCISKRRHIDDEFSNGFSDEFESGKCNFQLGKKERANCRIGKEKSYG